MSKNISKMVWSDTYHSFYGKLEIYVEGKFKICKLFKEVSIDKFLYIDSYKVDSGISNRSLADKYLEPLNPNFLPPAKQLGFNF